MKESFILFVTLRTGCFLLLVLMFGSLGMGCSSPQSSAEEGANPNVLLITVDDLRPMLGAYGHAEMHTPNIDRLASEGLLFERAYVNITVCAPSRIGLMSGLRPDSTDAWAWNERFRDVLPHAVTLPQHFKRHGYETVVVHGKVFPFADGDRKGWTRAPIQVTGDWKGPGGYVTEAAIDKINFPNPLANGRGPAFESPVVPDTAYEDGTVAVRAVEVLKHLKGQSRPFFLAVGFKKPHLPFNAPQKYWDLYPPETIALPDNYFPPKGGTPYSLTNFGELRAYSNMPDEGPIPIEKAKALIRGYRACVSYLDAQVGRLLNALNQLGMRDETIVLLWSDHGFKLGEHKSWSKHTNFEIDTHIPLIVRVPGYEGGRRTDALVETVDVYPALAELAGLPEPPQGQGLSFAPLLDDPDRPWKEAVFSQYPRGDQDGRVMGYSIRTDRYRYVEWMHVEAGEVRARELYDHREDPHENVNVAANPSYASTVEWLSKILDSGWRAALPEHLK